MMSVSEQSSLTRIEMNRNMIEGSTWYLVSGHWFRSWKMYTAYDLSTFDQRCEEEVESLHPGPMDNQDLLIHGTSDLKNGIVEGVDYVFFPEALYKKFSKIYDGGPDIPRKVVATRSQYSYRTQVELYPIKVQIMLESDVSNAEDPAKASPYMEVYVSATCTIEKAFKEVCTAIEKKPENCRLWLDVSSESSADDSDTEGSGGSNDKKRKLTCDVTDRVGGWHYIRKMDSSDTLSEMNAKVIKVMIESQAMDISSGKLYWPKDDALNEWKYHLRVGDVIDAEDECNDWYESEVLNINIHDKSIRVHFKGWSHKFDTTIKEASFPKCIAPLYSITKNWRDALEPQDKVDYTAKLNLKEGSKWLHAYVMKVDHHNGVVTVKYRDEFQNIYDPDEEIDINSECICMAGTHVKSKAPNFVYTPATVQRSTVATSSTGTGAYSSYSSSSSSRYTSSYYGSSGGYSSRYSNTPGSAPVVGAVGLCNLGNTCFMASMLQCLSNTKRLSDVFTTDKYVSQLNKDNPLGNNGKVAISFAKLMKEMWSGKYTSVAPVDFKHTIGEFQPQFAGYNQQDSQELMLFLLDGLHEDMNRIHKKPFVEKIESNDRDDELIAKESWRRFLLRNDSELVDMAFGQLRSHVTCSNCGNQSVTFDEYSSLSLPLPIKKTVPIDITVVPLPHGSAPVKLSFDVEVTASIEDVKRLVNNALHKNKPLKKRSRHTENTGSSSDYVVVGGGGSVGSGGDSGSSSQDGDGVVHVRKEDLDDLDVLGETASPDDVEIVDEDDDEDGVVVSSTSPEKQSRARTENSDDLDRDDDNGGNGGFYHFCLASKAKNPRIYKTFSNNGGARDLARNSYDVVIAFEMNYDVPVTNYSAYDRKPSPYLFVDILMGSVVKQRQSYSSYYGSSSLSSTSSFETIGPPHRLSYVKESATVGDIHLSAWKMMRPFLHDDSSYRNYSPLRDSPEDCPYEIHITSAMGSTSRGIFPTDMEEALSLASYDSLICVWREDAREVEHFDETAIERLSIGGAIGGTAGDNSDDENSTTGTGHVGNNAKKKKSVHVMDCLNKFIEREQMPPEETWYCPRCKEHNAPFKKFDIWTAPDVLIIHLKRFQYTGGTFPLRDKLSDLVDFPIENLDLRDYVKSPSSNCEDVQPIYDLYGVSEHMGGMGGGHYTAVAQNPVDQKWYSFNDSSVHETTPDQAVSPAAYVLFYKRRSGTARWAGMTPLTAEEAIGN